MPPTATEVNARLHKAVNEEGKVLNIAAVNEMVAWLEKINMTMEVLEDTRIGLRMNLMRKNIDDKELAKRVKNLLKKWKKNMEKLKEKKGNVIDTNNRSAAQLGNLQYLKRNIDTKQTGLKRKLVGADVNSLVPRSSPKVASPSLMQRSNQSSPLSNNSSPKSVSSPKLLNHQQTISSPKLGKHSRSTPSPLVSHKEQKCNLDGIQKKEDENEQSAISLTKQSSSNGIDKKVKEILNHNKKPELLKSLSTDNDSRFQEDRISSLDSGYHGTISDENSPSLSPNDKLFLPIDNGKATDSLNEVKDIKTHFDHIEPEKLEITRRELTGDPTLPDTEADGINGVFGNDRYYNWTEEITLDDYSVLPYVILD